MGSFHEDLADGRGVALNFVAARELLVKERRCEGMRRRMREHGAPAVDRGCREGVAQDGLGPGGLSFGPEA